MRVGGVGGGERASETDTERGRVTDRQTYTHRVRARVWEPTRLFYVSAICVCACERERDYCVYGRDQQICSGHGDWVTERAALQPAINWVAVEARLLSHARARKHRTHARTHAHTHTHNTHARARTRTHARTHARTRTHIHTHYPANTHPCTRIGSPPPHPRRASTRRAGEGGGARRVPPPPRPPPHPRPQDT